VTAIYVLTCPRAGAEPWPYVVDTVAAIDAEQLPVDQVLFVDGSSSPVLPASSRERWSVMSWLRPPTGPAGNKAPYWALLADAVQHGYDDVVVFEDDLEFCPNAVRRMVSLPVPSDVACVQFFAPHLFPAPETKPGLWRPPLDFQFCQAVKFPSRTMRALVDWQPFGDFHAADEAINWAFKELGGGGGGHVPELVQHVGAVSAASFGDALGDPSGRVARTYHRGLDGLRFFTMDERFR